MKRLIVAVILSFLVGVRSASSDFIRKEFLDRASVWMFGAPLVCHVAGPVSHRSGQAYLLCVVPNGPIGCRDECETRLIVGDSAKVVLAIPGPGIAVTGPAADTLWTARHALSQMHLFNARPEVEWETVEKGERWVLARSRADFRRLELFVVIGGLDAPEGLILGSVPDRAKPRKGYVSIKTGNQDAVEYVPQQRNWLLWFLREKMSFVALCGVGMLVLLRKLSKK